MSTGPMTSGHCLCGAVSYTISGDLRPIVYCHCEQCRRTSGHFVAATACKPSQISFDADDGLVWYRSSPKAKRGFCKSCGSNLFWAPEHHHYWSVFAGALDRPTGLTAASHIFVHMASDYYAINDALPTYENEFPPYFPDEQE
jgi:hypothetical protein